MLRVRTEKLKSCPFGVNFSKSKMVSVSAFRSIVTAQPCFWATLITTSSRFILILIIGLF
nr:MAG TPA: hypothetical protein [Caudoviricetes sp.]